MRTTTNKTRVLFIQHEPYTWARARHWGYNWHLGFEEGLVANNINLTTLITPFLPWAKKTFQGIKFDQIWMNDITHSYEPSACGGHQLKDEDFEWIASLAPIRLGFIIEALSYSQKDLKEYPWLTNTRNALYKTSKYFTHLIVIDECDVKEIGCFNKINVLWTPCAIPSRFIIQEKKTPCFKKGIMRGSVYGERRQYITDEKLKDLTYSASREDNVKISDLFDNLFSLCDIKNPNSQNCSMEQYNSFLNSLRYLRQTSYKTYLNDLSLSSVVINLPALANVHTGKVYEGMASGRPVLTKELIGRPLLNKFFIPGVDLITYNNENDFLVKLKQLISDVDISSYISNNATKKLLSFHTTEVRVRQILDWISTGLSPDFIPKEECTVSTLSQKVSIETNGQAVHNKNLKILLVNPPYSRFIGISQDLFPLSLGSLATIAKLDGHDVSIYDANFEENPTSSFGDYKTSFLNQELIVANAKDYSNHIWQEIFSVIQNFSPDILGITVMTCTSDISLKIAEITKILYPDANIVLGGCHPNIYSNNLINNEDIDFIVLGEGELTFRELVCSLSNPNPDLSKIEGLIYKKNNLVFENKRRALIQNLDTTPIPDRSLILNERYRSQNNMIISRGCPFSCTYSAAKLVWTNKVRRKSTDEAIKEVKYLLEHSNSRHITFWDDSFTSSKNYIKDLTSKLSVIQGLTFSCLTRLDLIDEEILQFLKDAHCTQIMFGIESGDDSILKKMNKKMNRSYIKQKIALVKSFNIKWFGFFIIGYPGETEETIMNTSSFMKELDPDHAQVNIFNSLPGTETWNQLISAGLISNNLDTTISTQANFKNNFLEPHMDQIKFKELALMIAKNFDRHNISKIRHKNIIFEQMAKIHRYIKRRAKTAIKYLLSILNSVVYAPIPIIRHLKLANLIENNSFIIKFALNLLTPFTTIKNRINFWLSIYEMTLNKLTCLSSPSVMHILLKKDHLELSSLIKIIYNSNPSNLNELIIYDDVLFRSNTELFASIKSIITKQYPKIIVSFSQSSQANLCNETFIVRSNKLISQQKSKKSRLQAFISLFYSHIVVESSGKVLAFPLRVDDQFTSDYIKGTSYGNLLYQKLDSFWNSYPIVENRVFLRLYSFTETNDQL